MSGGFALTARSRSLAKNIRPKVVSRNASGALDCKAVVSSDPQPASDPLGDQARVDLENSSQSNLASDGTYRFGDLVHGANLARLSTAVNRFSKCTARKESIGFLTMAAPISPDPEKAQTSELLKKLIREKGYTHQSFSEAIGVSPGLVSQWATNRGMVPAERALKVASLLGTEPEIISPSWRELRDQFVASQSVRLDAETIRIAITVAQQSFKLTHGEELVIELDPELFSQALRTAIALRQTMEGENVESGPGNGQVGAAGGVAGTQEDGEEAKPARSRQRKRA